MVAHGSFLMFYRKYHGITFLLVHQYIKSLQKPPGVVKVCGSLGYNLQSCLFSPPQAVMLACVAGATGDRFKRDCAVSGNGGVELRAREGVREGGRKAVKEWEREVVY